MIMITKLWHIKTRITDKSFLAEPEKMRLHKGQRSQIQNSFVLHTFPIWGTYLHRITDPVY